MPVRFYKTVTVNGVELCSTLGCVVENDGFEMEPPEPITTYVDVPGRIDGPIDMSEAITGYPYFGHRTMKIAFIARANGREAGEKLLSRAASMLHNKRAEIQLGWDPGYTYKGRITVSTLVRNLKVVGFTMTAECEPYKYLRHVTVQEDCAGGKTLVLPCGDAPTVPTWTLFSRTSLNFGGTAYELDPGNYQLPDILLREGENYVYAYTEGRGNGSLRTYQECKNDSLTTWMNRTIADWIWKTKPTGGLVRADYEWKDL